MARWDIWTLVVGEKLPADWVTIPGLEIHPADEEEVSSLRSQRIDVSVEFDPGHPNHFDVSRAPVRVESRWILRLDLDAEDRDDALERARAEAAMCSSLLDSLAPEARKPFHLEVLAVGNQETGEVVAMPLQWNIYPVTVGTMSDDDLSALRRRASLLLGGESGDATQAVRSAAGLLRDATYLADTAMGVQLLENASLLLYFQIIEGIAQFIARSTGGTDHAVVDSERKRIKGNLVAALQGAGRPGEASRLIHQADYELRQVEATHLKNRIETAGQVIGVPERVIEQARSFLGMRNSQLAHFGASLHRKDWVRWFHQRNGRLVATHYFAAFLDWLAR